MSYLKGLVVGGILLTISFFAHGQHNLTLYSLGDFAVQSNEFNPAFVPKMKFTLGLPVISNLNLSLLSPVHLNDVYKYDDVKRKYVLNLNRLYDNLGEDSYFRINVKTQLFNIGYRANKFYLGLSANLNVRNDFLFPKEFFRIVTIGAGPNSEQLKGLFNGSTDLDDEGYYLNASKLNLSHISYADLSVTYTRFISKYMNVGLRAKFLSGISNASLENTDASLSREPNEFDYSLTVNEMHLRSAGVDVVADKKESEFKDIVDYLQNARNLGLAFDLGFSYKVNPKMKVSASVTDLGLIYWKSDAYSRSIRNQTFTYDGLDLDALITDTLEVKNYFETLKDSVERDFTPVREVKSYRTYLKSNLYLGFQYKLWKFMDVGLNARISNFAHKLDLSTGIYSNLKLGKSFIYNLNLNYSGRSLLNVGTGIALNMGFMQFLVLTDNILPLFVLGDTRNFDFRFGLNFLFGRNSFKKKKLKLPSNMQEINSVIN